MIFGHIKMKFKYKTLANEVIDLEISALQKLKKSIDHNFEKAIKCITNCKSKIILCGVGKSGLIASKIAATLSSVGCPSFSLSANDCLHGDLGSISRNDILILISNSGNSEELFPIIKYANRNKIKLIGIMSKKNSILYQGSDIKILIPEVKEAGLGIVPTSSTTIQLAIGDALAVVALNKKKFNEEYRLGNGELLSILDLAKLFNCKIKMISERKGERMGQSAKKSNGFKKLNYKPKYNIKSYISDFINK